MKKIIEYRAVNSSDILGLTENVRYWIERGLQPFGSIAISEGVSADGAFVDVTYAQAMVKYEDE